jgi:hypothetical protein
MSRPILKQFNRSILLSFFSVAMMAVPAAKAATIWNGPQLSFTKVNGGNPNLPANQDRIVGDLWLTRGSSQGLFNIHNEAGFSHFLSPSGTQWADGALANFASLSYTDWNTWAKGLHGGPSSTVGINAVVHIVPDDIYFSIKFTSWTSGGAGGGFSYLRSTQVPEPSAGLLLAAGLVLAARRWRR